MTNTIKWYYKGTEIYFISTEENFERHKIQNAARLGLTDPEITIIENATTDSPITTDTPCRNCGAKSKSKSALPVDSKTTSPAGDKTSGLFYMSGISSDVDPSDNTLESDGPDLDLLDGTVDRLAL